jgi:hypothetical protein
LACCIFCYVLWSTLLFLLVSFYYCYTFILCTSVISWQYCVTQIHEPVYLYPTVMN